MSLLTKSIKDDVIAWVSGLFTESADPGGGGNGKKELHGIRWPAIVVALCLFFYEAAQPLLNSKNSVYMDLRFGILLWLFLAALLHTPMGSSEVEDHPSFLFASVFILLLVVTHMTLAAFTVLHHVFAWLLQLCFPKLAETLWAPALRSVRSFKAILKASIVLSGSLSFLFAYCGTIPERSCVAPMRGELKGATVRSSGAEVCTPTPSNFKEYFVGVNPRDHVDVIHHFSTMVCVQLLPQLDEYWGKVGDDGQLNFSFLGLDLGRLSLLESPIGLLWMSGIALWATLYTLRRTKRINQTLLERAKRRRAEERSRSEDDADNEASEDEYEHNDDNSAAPLSPVSEATSPRAGPCEGLPAVMRRKGTASSPTNFRPMAEWYSLAVTKTAFDVLISMKLFLGRFDMRTMQAAIRNEDDYADDLVDDDTDTDDHESARARGLSADATESDANSFGGYETASSTLHRITARRGKGEVASAIRVPSPRRPATRGRRSTGVHRHRKPKFDNRYANLDELWFDWLADTGDGGNPTYAVARAVAQPTLSLPAFSLGEETTAESLTRSAKVENLKRGDLLVLGGDLAYPTPSRDEYDARLFVPFEDALEPPPTYHRDDISLKNTGYEDATLSSRFSFVNPQARSVDTDAVYANGIASPPRKRGEMSRQTSDVFHIGSSDSNESLGALESKDTDADDSEWLEDQTVYKGPPCMFAIPGNHDWFDGLDTFMQCICYRDWFGGWRMPQSKSYFALQLPHGWWLFGLDYALENDIDGLQYQYFASVAQRCLGENDQVILCSHEPTWVLDAYLNNPHPEDKPLARSAKNLKQLMRRHLRGKVALRIAGDIHNYMRHDAEQPIRQNALRAGAAPVLVTSGGGGAFLHPTHTFPERYKETGGIYKLKSCYPSHKQSRAVSMKNLGQGFRLQNWKFDIVGSTAYFLLVASFFPRCSLDHITKVRLYPNGLVAFGIEMLAIFSELWSESVVSLVTVLVVFLACFSFADHHYGMLRQLVVGVVHSCAHVSCAVVLFLLLEIVTDLAVQDGLAGQGYDSFFESFQSFERRTMPKAWWTTGLSESVLRLMLRVFDLPESMATTRVKICGASVVAPAVFQDPAAVCQTNVTGTLTRLDFATYYGGNFLYLYIIAADIAAMVLGLYLFVSVNVLKLHWNEAFSSIRSPDYKSFVRFHIDKSGDLHAYSIGIERVPSSWRLDERWSSTWNRLLRTHLCNPDADLDALDPSIASFGASFPSKWIPAYLRDRKKRKEQEPRIVDYFCIPRKRQWFKPRRGNSVHNDWWEAFEDLEQRKVFRKSNPKGGNRHRRNHSQSPQSASERFSNGTGRHIVVDDFSLSRNATSIGLMEEH